MGNPVSSFTGNIMTAVSGNFLTANNGGGLPPLSPPQNNFAVQANRTAASQWETFNVVWSNEANTFGLQTSAGNFLTAVNGGNVGASGDPIVTTATVPNTWEQFIFNFNPPLEVSNPVNPVTGAIGPYALASPNVLQQAGPQTVTIQTGITSNFLTAQNNGGMNVDSTGQAISTDRTQMQTWETFVLSRLTPTDVYSHMQITIGTGGDDLRSDSHALISFLASNQLKPAPGTTPPPFFWETLKSEGDPGWGNNTTNVFNFQLPQPLPPWVFGSVTVTMGSDPLSDYPILTSDNWDISRLDISLYNVNPVTNQISNSTPLLYQAGTQLLPDGSTGLARLTGDNPAVTLTIPPPRA